jgi:hypothetical protein
VELAVKIMKIVKDLFRVWVDDNGEIVMLLAENGHDTFYKTKRATKADKDQLFETDQSFGTVEKKKLIRNK